MVLGLSKQSLADLVKLSHTTVSRVLSGDLRSPQTVKKLADALGLAMADLVVDDQAVSLARSRK